MIDSALAVLLLVSTIATVDNGIFTIDLGLVDGLRVGDRGDVYYELSVAADVKTVDVGEAEVTLARTRTAELRQLAQSEVRPGYLVRFRVPAERAELAAILEMIGDDSPEGMPGGESQRLLDAVVPDDPELQERLLSWLLDRRQSRELGAAVNAPATREMAPPMVDIAAGIYEIGLGLGRAEFFNQQPVFRVTLRSFKIDRRVVSLAEFEAAAPNRTPLAALGDVPTTSTSYEMAANHCASRGGRLPSEFEWEVAMKSGNVEGQKG
ncbi:MAG: SUMF1/EgtB/PvdO family nonheme iron enzyme, partial [Acidobacteriota bacterium]|nr:SUMF1/EgtB/PvdO family nonheme iron enzyme [Acidobacteriota bacterium]